MSRLEGHLMKGWRFGALVGGLVGLIGITMYPIAIEPYFNQGKWQEVQKVARTGIKQEQVQPGNMKVWNDPFERKTASKE